MNIRSKIGEVQSAIATAQGVHKSIKSLAGGSGAQGGLGGALSAMPASLKDAVSLIASALESNKSDLAFGFEASAVMEELSVVSFEAREAVNEPFEIHVELASRDSNIDLHALMDTEASLGIYDKYDAPRFLSGIITEAERGDSGLHRTFYSVTLRPAIHRLAHISDSRIWQQKSIPEIVTEILAMYNIPNVEWRLGKKESEYAKREYATCYNEDMLSLIERFLAEEGIFYFFEHSADLHKLIITDAPFSTPNLSAAPVIAYNATSGGTAHGSFISSFSQREKLRSSTYEVNDYTFLNPPARMKEAKSGQENNGLSADYALYHYPARYKDPDAVGKSFARHRIEAVRVDATTGRGRSKNIHLSPGYHFTLTDHDDLRANGSHFLLGVTHKGQQSAALEEEAGDAPTTYDAGFTTMPARLPYRPPIAKKPVIDGTQIATVTGPAGEEIYCDEHGRVKVHFPWDRHGEKNENSSCWIRVSQPWAGSGMGGVIIPRIGDEVIISNLDGDIDQPIVIGRTFNAVNKGSLDLPAAKTQTVIKSKTHKGAGANELRFEDENGKQDFYMHAQKDHNVVVKNDQNYTVEQGNQTNTVQTGDQTNTVSTGNHTTTIAKGNRVISVDTGNETKTVGSGSLTETIAAARSAFANTISTSATKGKGGPGTQNHAADDQIDITVGDKAKIMLDKTQVVLQFGEDNKITIDASGVHILGTVINLNK